MKLLYTIVIFSAVSTLQADQVQKSAIGDRIAEAYYRVLKAPLAQGDTKLNQLEYRLSKLTNTGTVAFPHVIAEKEIPELVALRAIKFELGSLFTPNKVEARALAKYPASARRSWSPMARRLWLEATYEITSHLPTVKFEVEAIQKKGVDTTAIESILAGHGLYGPEKALTYVEKNLAFSETHPKDIAASKAAAFTLYYLIVTAKIREPLLQRLLDRVFALESRTLQNQNALLNDNQKSLKTFEVLRKTARSKA
jgi:hypothetical protein